VADAPMVRWMSWHDAHSNRLVRSFQHLARVVPETDRRSGRSGPDQPLAASGYLTPMGCMMVRSLWVPVAPPAVSIAKLGTLVATPPLPLNVLFAVTLVHRDRAVVTAQNKPPTNRGSTSPNRGH